MGIQFAIHTYGHFDAMFYVLNGIKMIMNSDFAGSLIKLIALIATSYYAILGMAGASEGKVGTYLLKTAGMLIVINALLMPKSDMLVVDRVSGKKEIVRGLPYAFVLPVGILEAVGAGITSLFEQAFAPVSSIPYSNYGMIFGHRIVQEARNWRIANPEFARNMDVFLQRCVVLEAMIGSRFTPVDVKASNDLVGLVTENAGTFRKVDFILSKKRTKLTCKDAGEQLKKYFNQETRFLSFKYKNSDFSLAGGNSSPVAVDSASLKLNKVLSSNLEAGYSRALGVDSKAEEIIRQNMMINSIMDFAGRSDLYAYTRASGTQNSNWFVLGELAKEYIPIFLNIAKALIYASFIFLVPLMILSGGMNKYLNYCVIVFSLQIWSALNSILNLFIELYGHLKGSGITNGELSFANFNQAHKAVDTIVLVASSLQIAVPFISFALVKGGTSGLIHLAGLVQSASTGAAGSVAGEIASGNRSFDNISRGSESIDQKGGFKTDWNQLHQEGAMQVQGLSGAMLRSFADGSSSITSGSGVNLSSGSRKFGLSSGMQTSAQEGLSNALTAAVSADQNFTNSVSSQKRSAASLVADIAQRESENGSFDYRQLGEKGQNLQKMVNAAKAYHDRTGDGWEQSAQASIDTYIDAGGKLPDFVPFVKAEAGVKAQAGVMASNRSNQSLDTEGSVSRSNDTSKSFTNQEAAAKNKQWMQDRGIDTRFAEETQSSFERGQTYQQTASQKREEADSYRQALEYYKNTGATDDRDMYHDVEKAVMDKYKVSQDEAHNMIETYDPRVDKVWSGIVDRHMGSVIDKVKAGKDHVENIGSEEAASFHSEHSNKVNDQGLQDLRAEAAKQGLNREEIQDEMTSTRRKLEERHKNTTDENNTEYQAALNTNENLEKGLQERAKKYEEDRVSHYFGIGGDTSAEKAIKNLENSTKPLKPIKGKNHD